MGKDREPRGNEIRVDAFKEVCNICAGHAAIALSKIVEERIKLSVPSARLIPLSEVTGLFGGDETPAAGVYMRVEGECPGSVLLLLDEESARKLAGLMTKKGSTPDIRDKIPLSAFQEMGSIVLGSYLNALNQITGYIFRPLVPAVAVDMAGALIGTVISDVEVRGELVFNVETRFNIREGEISGYIVMLPDEGTLERITDKLGVKLG